MIKKTQSLLILLLFTGSLFSQTPFIRNYTPEESIAGAQNWSIVQDQRGVMYFANNNGVLEYDGINWKTIKTPGIVYSLCIDSSDCIYVGLDNDFGYLQSDSTGSLQYKSLKYKIPEEHQDFNKVWNIHAEEDRIILYAVNKIFVYQNNSFSVLMSGKRLRFPHVVRGKYYISEAEKGFMYLKGDSLFQLPGSEQFSKIKPMVMLPYGDDEILIVTENNGIKIYNPKKSLFLRKPDGFDAVNEFLNKNRAFYHGVKLPNGHFAIGTRVGGILVFDKHGKIQNYYYKQNGLQSNNIHYLFTDLNGQLWAALENGISLVMNNLPFTNYTDKDGLDGSVYCIQKFKDKLYVGTSNKLYVQNKANNFESIEGTIGQNIFLHQANGKLLLGNFPNGIFNINDNKALQAKAMELPFVVAVTLRKHSNYIITQVWDKGLALIEYKNEQWIFKHFINGFDQNARYIEEDDKGNLWINANSQLYKLRLNETLDSVILKQNFTAEQYRLPGNTALPFRLNNGKIIFNTIKGIYRYVPDKNYFESHPDFPIFPNGLSINKHDNDALSIFNQDTEGNFWFEEVQTGNVHEKGVLRLINGEYETIKTPFLKFTGNSVPNNYALYPYSDSLVYIGTNKGLLEYYPKQKVNYEIPFNTLIREIAVKDSLFYGGSANVSVSNPENTVKLKYEENNMFFHYAATFYEDSEKNLFSYRLIGSSDTTWSAWTNDHKKEYTNLHEGKYIFEVKSQNIYRKYGNKAAFTFKILPPWYRTWWAYTLFGIALILIIILVVWVYSQRLIHQKEQLEIIVSNRTAEVVQQKEELIKLGQFKEGMTGMIVHDLKNPLSTIIGLSEKHEIVQAGKQMLNMVLNILDVQKFEDAEVKLQLENIRASRVINDALQQVKSLYNRKSIEVKQNINAHSNLLADKDIVNRVLVNILSNAIKYTPNNGSIKIYTEAAENSDFVKISISDTGAGIAKENLASVFDKFSQVDAKKSGGVASTGLGLTFCKLAVEAHGGEIGVESEPGSGTTFWFVLPIADADETTIIEADDTTIKESETSHQLTDAEIKYLAPFVVSLKEFTVYEFSDIITILNTIETQNRTAVYKWKTDLENAVRACNEIRYNDLLKLEYYV